MKKLLLAAALTATTAMSAQAEYAGKVGYSHVDIEFVTVGAIVLGGAYEFDTDSDFTSSVEVGIGTGIVDDDAFGANVDLDYIASIGYRGSFDFSDSFYGYIIPSVQKVKVSASGPGGSASASSDWEFGFGAGLGTPISDSSSLELQYENVDDADIISLGARFNF